MHVLFCFWQNSEQCCLWMLYIHPQSWSLISMLMFLQTASDISLTDTSFVSCLYLWGVYHEVLTEEHVVFARHEPYHVSFPLRRRENSLLTHTTLTKPVLSHFHTFIRQHYMNAAESHPRFWTVMSSVKKYLSKMVNKMRELFIIII